jgi:hypothetical protein
MCNAHLACALAWALYLPVLGQVLGQVLLAQVLLGLVLLGQALEQVAPQNGPGSRIAAQQGHLYGRERRRINPAQHCSLFSGALLVIEMCSEQDSAGLF